MTDRELLELAAKAAGIDYWVVKFAPRSAPIEKLHTTVDGETVEWNPLTDDGDALRLAVKIGMSLHLDPASVCLADPMKYIVERASELSKVCPYAAARRAIVRAAAEIGKTL